MSRPHEARFSVAPMMDWTDRRCRAFHRILTRRARVFTDRLGRDELALEDWNRVLDIDYANLAGLRAIAAIRRRQNDANELVSALHQTVDRAAAMLDTEELKEIFRELGKTYGEVLQQPFEAAEAWRKLLEVGRDGKNPRMPTLTVNNVLGVLRACQRGLGVAMLPDYLVEENGGLVQLFGDVDTLALDAYFVYPEELKSVARIQVFRDFLVANAQRWHF